MIHRRHGRRGSRRMLALAGATAGLTAVGVGAATPAWAGGTVTGPTGGNAPSANHLVVFGGAQTTYGLMLGLSTLFDQAPGCDLAAAGGTTQPLDYGCPGIDDAGGSLSATNNPANSNDVGQNGLTAFGQENPFNDVLVQEPSLGSSNGIKELEDQGAHAPHTTVTVPDVSLTAGSTAATTTASFAAVTAGEVVTGADQGILSGTTVSAVNSSTSITLSQAAADTGTFSLSFSASSSGVNVAPLDVARDSRAPNLTTSSSAGDDKGLNFVAYAMDGVSWFHWTKVGPTATPSSTVTNLTVAQLTQIWTDSLSCTVSGHSYTMNWICVGGKNAPIAVYIAQSGAGTESTWATLLGLSTQNGGYPFGNEPASNQIFENETESITSNTATDEGPNNAIFFFSYGNFTKTCKVSAGYCGAKPAGWHGGAIALGEIDGIKVDSATIAAQLPGASGTPFPGDRLLYNVYSDGSNPDIPVTSDAALNAVSEDGFLCKPSTVSDIDPNTGASYRSEIDSVIEANGFYPLPLGNETGTYTSPTGNGTTYGGASIANPAWNELSGSPYDAATEAAQPYNFPSGDQDTDNSAVNGTKWTTTGQVTSGGVSGTASDPAGYCLVLSTDSNSTN